MSNITLQWEYINENTDPSNGGNVVSEPYVYLVDIYKSANPINNVNLHTPIITNYSRNIYIDKNILPNKIYYYKICYKNKYGTYISTINKKVVTSKKDLFIDNLKTYIYLNDFDKNYIISSNYKNFNSSVLPIGFTRTILKKGPENAVYYTSGSNATVNNTENGGIKIDFPNTINNSDFTFEFFGGYSNLDNIYATLMKMDASNNKGFFIDIINNNNKSMPALKVIQPTKIRYIRDWLNGSTSNAGNHWVEIQAFDINNTNVALNKSGISSTNEWNALVTNNVTSSDPYFSIAQNIQWVKVDLGAVYDITTIKIWHYYTDGRSYYNTKTEGSIDGVNWFTIFDSAVSGIYKETSVGKTHAVTSYNIDNITNIDNIKYDQYQHYCVMKKNNYMSLYIDGLLINKILLQDNYILNATNCFIGTDNNKTNSYTGYFDSIKFSNGALYPEDGFTPPSILDNYNSSIFLIKFNKDGAYNASTTNNIVVSKYGTNVNNLFYDIDHNKKSAIFFKNNNDQLITSIDFIENDFTLEFNLYIDRLTATNAYILTLGSNTYELTLQLDIVSGNINIKGVFGPISYTIPKNLNFETWYNICIIRTGIYAYIFIDGKLEYKIDNVITKFLDNYLSLGAQGTLGLVGYIDQFKIYDTVIYNIEGFNINEKNIYSLGSTKRNINIVGDNIYFEKDKISVYRKSFNKNTTDIIINNEEIDVIDIEQDINDVYEYSISNNLPNFGQYNKGNIIVDKFNYDTHLNNIVSKVAPVISDYNNLNIIQSDIISYEYDTDRAIIIDPSTFKDFCRTLGTSATANNTTNGGFNTAITALNLQDFCVEVRCIFTEPLVSNSRLFTIGVAQTNNTLKESGIWFRYLNDAFGIGLYRGTTPISFQMPVNAIPMNKVVDIALSRRNGIFYIYVNGSIVSTLDTCTDISIVGNILYFFTDNTQINALNGQYSNIRYTVGHSRYNGVNYSISNDFDILSDPLYNNVELAIDFKNSAINDNNIYDKSKNKKIITPVGAFTTCSLPTNEPYVYVNGSSSFGLSDCHIGTEDFTIEFDFALLSTTPNTWRTIFNIGKFGVEGNLKVVLSNTNNLMTQLYYNSRWTVVSIIKLSNDELSKLTTICITRNKDIIYSYVNKKLSGKIKTDGIFSLRTGIRFGKYINTYPNGGGETIHGLYKNIRISKAWRYFGQTTYEHNYKDQLYDIGYITSFNISYDGVKNNMAISSVGSFSHYILYRIDGITHYTGGEIISQGVWSSDLILEDSNIEENTSYNYILKLICGEKVVLSDWKNIYTNTINKYHLNKFTATYNKYDTIINWESDNNDSSIYNIYISDKSNPIEIDKSVFYTVNNANTYTIIKPVQNKKYYVYIERIIDNEIVGFSCITYNTDLYGLLFTNYSGFTTNMSFNFQPLTKKIGLFRSDWGLYHKNNHNPLISYNMRSAGSYSITNPNTATFNMNFIGLTLNLKVYNTINNSSNANFRLYFEDNDGVIYAYMQIGVDSSGLGASISYGISTTPLTVATKTGNYPVVDGNLEITSSSIRYINNRSGDYINNFTINNPNLKNITRLRITNVTNNISYNTGSDGTWSVYSELRILP